MTMTITIYPIQHDPIRVEAVIAAARALLAADTSASHNRASMALREALAALDKEGNAA